MHELEREVGLGIADVTLAIERLAVQVGEINCVRIDDGQLAHARTGERGDHGASYAARADHGDTRALQLALADSPDLRQHDVPRVAVELGVGKLHRPVEPKPPAPRLVSPSAWT